MSLLFMMIYANEIRHGLQTIISHIENIHKDNKFLSYILYGLLTFGLANCCLPGTSFVKLFVAYIFDTWAFILLEIIFASTGDAFGFWVMKYGGTFSCVQDGYPEGKTAETLHLAFKKFMQGDQPEGENVEVGCADLKNLTLLHFAPLPPLIKSALCASLPGVPPFMYLLSVIPGDTGCGIILALTAKTIRNINDIMRIPPITLDCYCFS